MVDTIEAEPGLDTALVTGGGSGAGFQTAWQFAQRGFNVGFGYRKDHEAAQAALQQLQAINPDGKFTAIQANIAEEDGRLAFVEAAGDWHGGDTPFAHVVLAASGGMESGADASYANEINNVAQVELTKALHEGGFLGSESETVLTILGSLQARFFGKTMLDLEGVELPIAAYELASGGKYAETARTKQLGVNRLLAAQSKLGCKVLASCTDVLTDTKLLPFAARRARMVPKSDFGTTEERFAEGARRLLLARQGEIEHLGLDPYLFSGVEFAGATVLNAVDTSWDGTRELLLPDHFDEVGFTHNPVFEGELASSELADHIFRGLDYKSRGTMRLMLQEPGMPEYIANGGMVEFDGDQELVISMIPSLMGRYHPGLRDVSMGVRVIDNPEIIHERAGPKALELTFVDAA